MGNRTLYVKPVIGIIGGRGKFGKWFCDFFESKGLRVLVAGRRTALSPRALAQKSDIVIVSVPIPEAPNVIRAVRDHVRRGSLLCDFTSLKSETMKEMRKVKPGRGALGIHPLFGPLVPSIRNQIIVLSKGKPSKWISYLERLFAESGASVIWTTPETHDKQMAVVQAFTHLINLLFANTVARKGGALSQRLSTPIFRLQSVAAGRVLGNSPGLFADIEMENAYFPAVLDNFLAQTNALATVIKKKDKKAFVRHFNAAATFMKHVIPIAQAKAAKLLTETKPAERMLPKGFASDGAVAYLGPEGTFSHEAARAVFSRGSLMPHPTITSVFAAVSQGEALFGIVPAENSTEGVVQETLDNLLLSPLEITGSFHLPIHLYLLGRTSDLSHIRTVKSHPQPLAQCRNWLAQHLPHALLETASSSAEAILSTKDPRVAFVASAHAAKKHKLAVLAENIEDKRTNITQFYIVTRQRNAKLARVLGAHRTMLVLAAYDRPGVLHRILGAFAKEKLNLSKLYSRPGTSVSPKSWDYYFFLEVESAPEAPKFTRALKTVRRYCSTVKILGVT